MKIIRNAGADRVINALRGKLDSGARLDIVVPNVSVFGLETLLELGATHANARIVVDKHTDIASLTGNEHDRARRNELRVRWLASKQRDWVRKQAKIRTSNSPLPQGALILRSKEGKPIMGIHGAFSLCTSGMGVSPSNPMSLIQVTESVEEALELCEWFDSHWEGYLVNGGADSLLPALGLPVYPKGTVVALCTSAGSPFRAGWRCTG